MAATRVVTVLMGQQVWARIKVGTCHLPCLNLQAYLTKWDSYCGDVRDRVDTGRDGKGTDKAKQKGPPPLPNNQSRSYMDATQLVLLHNNKHKPKLTTYTATRIYFALRCSVYLAKLVTESGCHNHTTISTAGHTFPLGLPRAISS